MGSLSLLQGIFPTQGSNRGFLHCRQILYHLSYERKPVQPYLQLQTARMLSRVPLFATLWTVALHPWDFPGKDTAVVCHFLLRGIFPTQGVNPRLLCCLHCRWTLYQYHHLKALTLLGRTQILCFLTAAPLRGGPKFVHRLKHAEGLHVAQPHQYPWDSWA